MPLVSHVSDSTMVRKILSSFSLALENIRSNIFHTILSVLGIVIGVGALVSILSLIDGMERFAREQVSTTTSLNAIVVRTELYKTVNNVRLRKDTVATLSFEAFKSLHGALSKKVTRFYRVSGSEMVTISGREPAIGVATFATDTTMVPGVTLLTGTLFTEADLNERREVVIANRAFVVAAKYDSIQVMGEVVSFKSKQFKLIGVVEDKGGDTPHLYFPATCVNATELSNNPADVAFEVEHTEDIAMLKPEIDAWLKAQYANGADDFRIITNEYRVEQLAKGFLLFRIIMGMIVGISVIVGGIGVMNVLLISVTERTTEIGIRKAMGANRRDIVFLFLTESVTVSAFGSMMGVIFGVGFTMVAIPIVKALTKVPFQADYTINTIVITGVVALFVGIVFGTYPAIRASRLNPVDAIRHE